MGESFVNKKLADKGQRWVNDSNTVIILQLCEETVIDHAVVQTAVVDGVTVRGFVCG